MSYADPEVDVTVIVATYNRAAVLKEALRCLMAQTHQSWRALIIGDHCTDETAEVVAAFNDPRLSFHNLPERFGEQAGPNSIGLALARTEYVAFLNQDDLWFPDHLESSC